MTSGCRGQIYCYACKRRWAISMNRSILTSITDNTVNTFKRVPSLEVVDHTGFSVIKIIVYGLYSNRDLRS